MTDINVAFTEMQNSLLGLTENSVPSVFRARQFLSDTVASLHMDELQGKIIVEDPSPIITDPDPTITYHEFMAQVMLSLLDNGNAYLWIKTRDQLGNPKSAYVCDPLEVNVNWDRQRLYRRYSWRDQTMTPDEDFLHIAINRGPGKLKGMGPIEAARTTTIQTAKAEEEMARTLAEDNYTPSLVIKSPEVKTAVDAERVLNIWMGARDSNGGGRKRPSVANTLTEFDQLTINPVDAQWIESRDFTVQQIGRLFGIHGFFLLVESGSSLTYSTTESLFRLLLTATLRPTYLERIEQAMSRLLPRGRIARFNTDEILRADILSRYGAYQIGTGNRGFLAVNEVREDEGLPPIPGGDELIVPSTTEPAPVPAPSLNGASA